MSRLAEQTHTPAALAWDRHGKCLAVSDGDDIVVYDAEAGTVRRRLVWSPPEGDRGPDGAIRTLQWLDGGGYLLDFRPSGGIGRDERGSVIATSMFWDVDDNHWWQQRLYELVREVPRPSSGVVAAPDGRHLAVADNGLPPIPVEIVGDLPRLVP